MGKARAQGEAWPGGLGHQRSGPVFLGRWKFGALIFPPVSWVNSLLFLECCGGSWGQCVHSCMGASGWVRVQAQVCVLHRS